MEAYITNSNAKSIVYNLDISSIDTSKEIFRIAFKWFSEYEIRGLLAFRLLFENPELFFQQYVKRKPIDNKQYIFEGKLPSYHSNPNCGRLLSKFHNYKIPEEIKILGDEKINEFRRWFVENMDSYEKDPNFFVERMRMRFNLEKRPEVVNYDNSGIETIENLNLEELDKAITSKINEAEFFYKSSEKNKIILDNFGKFAFIYKERKTPKNNNTNYSNEEIWDVLQKFEQEYKGPIIKLLREYYRVKYNPEIKFEGKLLEQLGFNLCSQCLNDANKPKSENEKMEDLAIKIRKIMDEYNKL